jgi:hypothetical protein
MINVRYQSRTVTKQPAGSPSLSSPFVFVHCRTLQRVSCGRTSRHLIIAMMEKLGSVMMQESKIFY